MSVDTAQGKLSPVATDITRSTFLPAVAVMRLKQEARKYKLIERAKSKKEWAIGGMVNVMWSELPLDVTDEISKDQFYEECSYWLNCQFEIPIVGASGETLRRWCELSVSYADPIFDPLKQVLSTDHFRKARITSGKLEQQGKVIAPAYMLATAASNKMTADEMMHLFNPPVQPTDYDRVVGWVDSLQTMKFDWLPKARRAAVVRLLQEIRKVLDVKS